MAQLAIHGGEATRKHPFAPRRTMGEAEKQAVLEVMDSGDLSGFFGSPGPQWLGGPKVQAFEQKWAKQYGFGHAISVNSWTTGLMTAVGLVSALFSDGGLGDMLAWVTLGIPTLVCFWYGWGRRGRG